MLFKQELVADVLSGRKRQTVRLKRPRVSVGRGYAVQTSYYSPSLGRITVTGLRPCTLAELTRRDIDREGWKGRPRKEFERYFAEVNHFEPDSMSAAAWKKLRAGRIWCIEFEPEKPASAGAKKKTATKSAKKSARKKAARKKAAPKKTTRHR